MPEDNIGPLAQTIERINTDPSFANLKPKPVDINLAVKTIDKPTHTPDGRFAPGNCANPLGRPRKESTLPDCIRSELEKIDPKTGKTNAQLIADQVMKRAISGDKQMIEIALDYVTGKPVQSINQQLLGAVQLNVTYEDTKQVIIDGDTDATE